MKRFHELRELSEDHHHGLALAQRARKAAAGKGPLTVEEAWDEIMMKFPRELEPHFQIEEEALAPLMEQHGDSELIQQLFEEHRTLRACVASGASRTGEDLRRFGELLNAHIRFEENELFETAQQHLTKEELKAVEDACHRRTADE